MNNLDPDTSPDELAAYALGALELDEMLAAEQAIASSPEHQEELRQLRQVVALLPFSAPLISPPAHVRERLFAHIISSQQADRADADVPGRVPPAGRLVRTALAVVGALVLALAVYAFLLQQQIAGLERDNRTLASELTSQSDRLAALSTLHDELASQLASDQAENARLGRRLDELSARLAEEKVLLAYVVAPGVATRSLSALNGSARGAMYMYPGNHNAVVVFSGLPALAPGKVYQFWLADTRSQVAAGTFLVDVDGLASLVVEAPRELDAFSAMMLTVEPAGGSSQPSAEVVLQGSL